MAQWHILFGELGEIDAIIQELGKNDGPMRRVADTVAAEHAVTQGFI